MSLRRPYLSALRLYHEYPRPFWTLAIVTFIDRLGRKGVIVFSLITTAISTLIMGFIDSLQAFYVLAVLVGLLADVGGPAYQAAVADVLPEEQRAGGFGLLRVVFNLAVVIGPAIRGPLAEVGKANG